MGFFKKVDIRTGVVIIYKTKCSFLHFLYKKKKLSVQNCQAKGQKLKLLRMKEWNIVNLLNLSKYGPKRLSIFSCCDAFLQIELIWMSKFIWYRAPDNFQVQRVITPYFWKWCVFAYFLSTVVHSTSEKIAYMYTFKIMLDTSVIQ